MTSTRTFRYRVKDKHARALEAMARMVNFVWNFCNDTQRAACRWSRRWPTGFDLNYLTAGTSRDLDLHAGTINATCEQYAKSLRHSGRAKLRYRGRRSLGWVPFKGRDLRPDSAGFRFRSQRWLVWLSRPIPDGAKIRDGSSFAQDARGRWYLNLVVEEPAAPVRPIVRAVGIDLGLKDIVALSTGEKVAAPQFYRKTQARLAMAQRANKKRLATALHAKVAAQRRDFLHKLSSRLVRDWDLIAVGDVSSSRLAKTRMAKSVNDAGWSALRTMLRYKAIRHGATYTEPSEHLSTQTCSECGSLGGPKGRQGLVVREWICSVCGVVHDRDTNSAQNHLRWGHPAPQGIPAL